MERSLPSAPPSAEERRPRLRRTGQLRWLSLRTIGALVLREMGSTYGRSPGGYAWVVLQPVIGIMIMSFIFSLGFRTPKLGTNFAIFFATGILPFAFYGAVASRVAGSISYSRALLNYPRVTYVDAILARAGLVMLMELLSAFIILTAIRSIWDTRTVFIMERAMLAYAMAAALGLGIGLLNCFLMTRFQLWNQIWSLVTRPLFLISGVIFIYESIPHPWGDYLLWNPLMHVTAQMRTAFYVGYDAPYVDPAYVFGVALGCGLLGMLLLHRFHRDMLEI